MKDMRRWGTGFVCALLVLSMACSTASAIPMGGRGGSNRPSDEVNGGGGSADAVGDPQDGNGGGRAQPYVEPDEVIVAVLWQNLKMLLLGRAVGSVPVVQVRSVSRMSDR